MLEKFKSACLRDSLPEVAERDLALHRHWVTRVSKNLEPIWLGLAVRILMKYSRLENFEESIGEHVRIVEAIVVKNKDVALKALASNVI